MLNTKAAPPFAQNNLFGVHFISNCSAGIISMIKFMMLHNLSMKCFDDNVKLGTKCKVEWKDDKPFFLKRISMNIS